MNEEEMIHCPYNYSHVILKSRMPTHLQKCREQFPLEKYTTCPFNATHDVPVPEIKYHADTCPDRKTMENYLYVMDYEGDEEDADPVNVEAVVAEENWDEEKISGSYLETKGKMTTEAKLFKPPPGKSKSERKAFCQNQMQKFLKEEEKFKEESPSIGPSHYMAGICKTEPYFPEPEPGISQSRSEEGEDMREGVRRTKQLSISRGSIIRD